MMKRLNCSNSMIFFYNKITQWKGKWKKLRRKIMSLRKGLENPKRKRTKLRVWNIRHKWSSRSYTKKC
jgi:hypothetical protein